jgi:hypothetical protein
MGKNRRQLGKLAPFFLTGVYETANQAVQTSRRILELFQQDQQRIEAFGKALGTMLRVFKQFQPLLLKAGEIDA